MKKLDKYVLKEMVGPFLISILAFVVLLIGRVIFDNINFIIEKRVPFMLVLRLIVFQLPWIAGMVIPLGALFGDPLWRSTGSAGTARSRPCAWPALHSGASSCPYSSSGWSPSILTLWLGEFVTPWANRKAQAHRKIHLGTAAGASDSDERLLRVRGILLLRPAGRQDRSRGKSSCVT